MADDEKQLVEAYPVPDTYVENLGRVEMTGNNMRLTFSTSRAKDGGEIDHEVTQRVVMPLQAVMPAVRMLLERASAARVFDVATLLQSIAGERSGMLQ